MGDFLSREDFIKQHGYDPETDAAAAAPAAPQTKGLPSLGNAARDVGVGAATALTDIAALPGVVGSLAGASWDAATTDAKFGPSLAKRMRVDDAEAQTNKHLADQVVQWKQQDPSISSDEAMRLLQQYAESKPYEDFQRSLLSNAGVRFAGNVKDTVRSVVGDERTEKERSWTDSALEVLGSSVVGLGPQAIGVVGGRLARNAVTKAVLSNPVGYTAARVLEAATPLTLPLTPGNVALNTVVGTALDQGMRYAVGDTTALDNNDSNLGGIAAVAGATGAAALTVAALRGRAGAVAGAVNVPKTPELTKALEGAAEGGAALKGGDFAAFGDRPTPGLPVSGAGIFESARNSITQTKGRFVDEFQPVFDMVDDVNGRSAAKQLEGDFSNLTGAGGRDAANADAAILMRDLNTSYQALTPEWQEQARLSSVMHQAETRLKLDETSAVDEIAVLQARHARNGGLNTTDTTRLNDLQDAVTKLRADDPVTRKYMPDISRAEITRQSDVFVNAPELKAFRDAVERVATKVLDDGVRMGRLSVKDAADMRQQFKYYMPIQQDVFDGTRGVSRVVRMFQDALDPAKRASVSNNVRSNSIRQYDPSIRTDPNTGVLTSPQDPMLAMSTYLRNSYMEMYNNVAAARIVKALTVDEATQLPSKYVRDGNIKLFEDSTGKTSFTSGQVRAALAGKGKSEFIKALNHPDTVAVRINGATQLYRFGDEAVAQLMRFEPTMLQGWAWLAKGAADAFKMNTTGILSPAFAPINALYDTTFAMGTRAPNRAFGPLDTMLRRIVGDTIGQRLGGRLVDPTAYVALPWHTVAGIGEVMAVHAARAMSQDLAKQGPLSAIAKSIGVQNWDTLVTRMLLAAERSKTMTMLDKGISHNSAISDMPHALNAFSGAANLMPGPVRATYQFYKDLISSVHASPKRQFWAQNYSLLERKYGRGQIPDKEIDKLVYDTRSMAGDMTRRAASPMQRQLEAATPYATPIRNGLSHLVRNMTDKDTASYVWPRLMMMMGGVMSTFYMMTNWDENAKKEFWINTPEWMRYRYLHIPTPDVLAAWARGEHVPFDNSKVYKMPLGPDLAPLIAGASAFLRGIGALPNGPTETAATGMEDFKKMLKDMLLPVVPPIINTPLTAMGGEIDIGGADARGGNVFRNNAGNPFQKGPQNEVASPLGEMSTTTQRILAVLFGANGMYLSKSIDAMNHATRFDLGNTDAQGVAAARPSNNYGAGLKAATTTFFDQAARRLPDVPLLWKGEERQYQMTSATSATQEAKQHIQVINGIRDNAQGPRGEQKRGTQQEAGGVVQRYLRDPLLLQVADDIRKWDRSGDYADLKKEYGTLAAERRAVDANYMMDKKTRKTKSQTLIDRMQENMDQQRLAIMYKEDDIKERFGPLLQPMLRDRTITMQSLDQVMRESIDANAPNRTR